MSLYNEIELRLKSHIASLLFENKSEADWQVFESDINDDKWIKNSGMNYLMSGEMFSMLSIERIDNIPRLNEKSASTEKVDFLLSKWLVTCDSVNIESNEWFVQHLTDHSYSLSKNPEKICIFIERILKLNLQIDDKLLKKIIKYLIICNYEHENRKFQIQLLREISLTKVQHCFQKLIKKHTEFRSIVNLNAAYHKLNFKFDLLIDIQQNDQMQAICLSWLGADLKNTITILQQMPSVEIQQQIQLFFDNHLLVFPQEQQFQFETEPWQLFNAICKITQIIICHQDSLSQELFASATNYVNKMVSNKKCAKRLLLYNTLLPIIDDKSKLVNSYFDNLHFVQNNEHKNYQNCLRLENIFEYYSNFLSGTKVDCATKFLSKIDSQTLESSEFLIGKLLQKLPQSSVQIIISEILANTVVSSESGKLTKIKNFVRMLDSFFMNNDSLVQYFDDSSAYFPRLLKQNVAFMSLLSQVLGSVPSDSIEIILTKMLESFSNEHDFTDDKWKVHDKMYNLTARNLYPTKTNYLSKNSLNEKFFNCLIEYLSTLFDKYQKLRINKIFFYLKIYLEINYIRLIVLKFVGKLMCQLDQDKASVHEKAHRKMCRIINSFLTEYYFELKNYQTNSQMTKYDQNDFKQDIEKFCASFNSYFEKLLSCCRDRKTVILVIDIIVRIRNFNEYYQEIVLCGNTESTLHTKLLTKISELLINNLNTEQCEHNDKLKLCWIIIKAFDCILIDSTEENIEDEDREHIFELDKELVLNMFTCCIQMFESTQDNETLLYAILAIEKMCFNVIRIDQEKKCKLRETFQRFAIYTEQNVFDDQFDSMQYQVGLCARWCVDNIFCENVQLNKLSSIKLTQDRFGARYDNASQYKNANAFVRCSYKVSSGVYFYEVTPLTDGKMQFGWATEEKIFDILFGLDTNEHSICFDTSTKCVRHLRDNFSNCHAWHVGDVIGCLIDFDNKRFAFYLNGQTIYNGGSETFEGAEMNEESDNDESYVDDDHDDEDDEDDEKEDKMVEYINEETIKLIPKCKINFSPMPYYATASLTAHQQCHFNFGQTKFSYPPNGVKFCSFAESSKESKKKYCLEESERGNMANNHYYSSRYFWFKSEVTDNRDNLFYDDPKQNEFNDLVKTIASDISNGRVISKFEIQLENPQHKCNSWCGSFGNHILNDIENSNFRVQNLRYIQSIIDCMRLEFESDKYDIMAMWIYKVIELIFDAMPNEKLGQLLYPNLLLANVHHTLDKHRTICIVLVCLLKFTNLRSQEEMFQFNFFENIRSEILNFFVQTISKTNDQWTLLFALTAFDHWKMKPKEFVLINEQHNVIFQLNNRLKELYSKKDIFKLLSLRCRERINYQLYFATQSFLGQTLNATQTPTNDLSRSFAKLSCKDKSTDLKLSLDLLSARSDCHWQSVRSVGSVHKNIYYYEVLLITNGPMQIGWSTRRTNFDSSKVGEDEFSFGIDGYNRCLWHDAQQHQLSQMSRWKAGDVIGCLFDKSISKFGFFINGSELPTLYSNVFFSKYPYHASVSLSAHQQVFFNFGQSPFRFAPKRVDYWDFHLKDIYLKPTSNRKLSVNFNGANLNNTLLAIESTNVIEGDITFNQSESRHELNLSVSQHRHKYVSSGKRALIECRLCSEQIPTKLLRFCCCPTNEPLCLDCLSRMQHCLKCSKRDLLSPQIASTSTNECRFCSENDATKLLRFECCVNAPLCLECLREIVQCPKCKNKKS